MALKKFQVKEGYAFFHLNNVGQRMKSVPAGGIVELPNINHFEQSWKLQEVKGEVPDVPNDLDLIEGVKGNDKLKELFEDLKVTTFKAVADLPAEDLEACFKGNKTEKADKAAKLVMSAHQLSGGA